MPIHIVVLAAGKGTRMKSATPKALHTVAGRRLLDHVLAAADALAPASVTVVVGHEGDRVREAYAGGRARFVAQEPQLGTGHALLQAEPLLKTATGTVVLLSGDVPLLGASTLKRLLAQHQADAAAATVLTAIVDTPHGYGRIVREAGRIVRIVEERDASPDEQAIGEINSGIYALDLGPLFDAVRGIASQNAQGEYYLPDLVGIYRQRGLAVSTVSVSNPDEIRGINSRRELADVGAIVRHTKNEELMAAGVTLVDPATTYIEPGVVVGADTVIHPNVYLEGRTVIGEGCEIHAGTRIVDSTIGDRVLIRNYCVITESSVAARAVLGPFAHLRPASHVLDGAHIGNFVELKKTTLGRGSKASHLTYLGDATIGDDVNIGAGTITCNFDGKTKNPTVIEDGAFIGSDSALVAPVTIGRGAYVAAGSTITEDVPANALGIARSRQVNKEAWVKKR
ncbi:MAG TPA: bifunctional UDP-N-acetylglucosamine diphosphorylase/glucosamine-1-phosphate N-acetyltransferase GlmU [Vicinamibacterales bacterium]|nr:bifunctional UDP-N-acetylglucosamine diphosphorylase/glucosamine-1-phosphate N-acetyltransferase GlmU [Vicinamibacterales bacterium]